MQNPGGPWNRNWVGLSASMRERHDLGTTGLLAALIPFIWVVVLEWSPGTLVSGHDAILQVFTSLRDLAAAGGAGLRYRPDLMGGVKMADAFGNLTLPYFRASLAIGLTPLAAYNSFVFLCQLAIAVLGLGAIRGLVKAWSGAEPKLTRLDCASAGIVLAFAPVLAWRICYGHLNLLLGSIAFYIAFCAVVLVVTRTLTISMASFVVLGLWHALQSTGQQIILYGAVFGGVVLVALFMHLSAAQPRDRLGASLRIAGVLALPLLAALPSIAVMLGHAASSDAARGLSTESVTYGFATSTWQDWAASIPWAKDLIPTGRSSQLQHELNYAFGPLLVGLVMMPWNALKSVGAGLIVCALVALLFSMNVAPVSTVLPDLIGLLPAFRVPARALLPFAAVIPVLAVAAIVLRFRCQDGASDDVANFSALVATLVGVVLAFGLLPSGVREAVAWILTLVAVVLASRRVKAKWLTCTIFLVPLAGATLAAFNERRLPYTPQAALVTTAEQLGNAVKAAEPRLASALTRARLDFDVAGMWLNSGYAMKVSTLDGYWAPSRRMLQLYFALEEAPYDPTLVALAIRPGTKAYAAFRQLYNLCCEVSMVEGTPRVRSLGRTAGEAWIAHRIVRIGDTSALAAALRDSGDTLADGLRETLWLVEGDPHAASVIPTLETAAPQCNRARVKRVAARPWSGRITIEVVDGAGCPLVVATNYAETLQAHDQLGRRLTTFPAYGPLLGILMGPDSTQIVVEVP
ncbi:MAG: hypothetical protein A3F77_15945 [Betaproteobacteria bacterium RIFCSPLOWO2_12_FULL_67_28]|nr:MAG: hypothetical protein A3F77_15945 [Betaproteobacteria bacterium RIFCSPLOWO2_12_FULL_67_28]